MASSKRKVAFKVGKASARISRLSRREHGPHGYARLLGLDRFDSEGLGQRVLQGFRFSALQRLQKALGLSAHELGTLLSIKPRTLARRKIEGRLQADESDRLLRVARVLGRALELFEGDEIAARHWLTTENRALGEREPLALVRTELGARDVEALIGRLEHGVIS